MTKSKYLLGAVVGGVLGAALGVLMAPRSGVETREMLKDSVDKCCGETKKRVEHEWHDKTEVLKAKADSISDRVKQLSEEIETRGHSIVDKVAGAVKGVTTNGKSTTTANAEE